MIKKKLEYHQKWRDKNREKLRAYMREYSRKWRQTHKDTRVRDRAQQRVSERRYRNITRRKWRTGFSSDLFDATLKKQNNRCAICDVDLNRVLAHADHDHLLKQPRGILCRFCNLGLGQFKDNVKFLENAVQYLKNWKKKHRVTI